MEHFKDLTEAHKFYLMYGDINGKPPAYRDADREFFRMIEELDKRKKPFLLLKRRGRLCVTNVKLKHLQ